MSDNLNKINFIERVHIRFEWMCFYEKFIFLWRSNDVINVQSGGNI